MPGKVLLRHEEVPNLRRLDVYESDGGYQAARRALTEHDPAQLIEIVGLVAVNVFTNYLNNVAETDIDFPVVLAAEAA